MGSKDKNEFVVPETRNVSDLLRVPGHQLPAHLLHPLPHVQVSEGGQGIVSAIYDNNFNSRLRSHRAERRYGVQGDKSAQELTHLPTAMEEDESELEEDETLFDINKTRVYVA